jgi:hypothetical protein
MTLRSDLLAEQAEVNRKLAILNSAPPDTYPFGTIVVFASGPQGVNKWWYRKVQEETWANMSNGIEQELSSWVLAASEALDGAYFEIYVLLTQPAPIYASA